MGAWGTGPFDNDDAADFLIQYEDGGASVVSDAFAAVKSAVARGYVDVDVGSAAIAAAEIVSASGGFPRADLDPGIQQSIMIHASDVAASRLLVAEARDAVRLIGADEKVSELLGLWTDSEHLEEWRSGVEDLQARLKAVEQ